MQVSQLVSVSVCGQEKRKKEKKDLNWLFIAATICSAFIRAMVVLTYVCARTRKKKLLSPVLKVLKVLNVLKGLEVKA